MATLTGAQGVATGRYHGAVLTNKEVWEPACMAAGKASGDLVVSTFYNCHWIIFGVSVDFPHFSITYKRPATEP